MPSLIGTNLTVIAQAVEQRLLTFTSAITGTPVCGDLSNIYWVEEGEQPQPGQTGQRDVLLSQHLDDTEGSVVGGGRFSWIAAGMDINIRSTLALDKRSTRRDFFIAHRLMIDGLMDAMMGFLPEDASHNLLTIEGFVLDTNATPVRGRDTLTWGYTVGTYRFHYVPNINRSILG